MAINPHEFPEVHQDRSDTSLAERFRSLHTCVIIPTYNNERTLSRVIDQVLACTEDVIVIDDGSTDSTADILAEYSRLDIIHFDKNQGKGAALKAGFQRATERGFDYAISIDSDGQHYPSDLTTFLDRLEQSHSQDEGPLLLIGSRNMGQEDVPKKSSFGNKFSNFWFWVETGISLQDTQSGYRCYPLIPLKDIQFFTNRFEFEIEVIVRAAWEGVSVENIPVQVNYDPEERVSHFRPVRDFARISVLNTCLIIALIFYFGPRNLIRRLRSKGLKTFFREDVLGSTDSSAKKAASLALGVFIGLTPLWGLHTFLALGLAVAFRLNKALAFAASNVSIPPMIPVIVLASIKIGSVLLNQPVEWRMPESVEELKVLSHLKVYVVGSLALAIVSCAVVGSLSYLMLKFTEKRTAIDDK